MVTVRRALRAEQEAVEALSQQSAQVKEFKFLWRRYQNWAVNRQLPIVAVQEGALVGFHAASFGREYVNSYYQLTTQAVRGQGVGGQMVEFLLREAARLGCARLKFKVPRGSEGQRFWEGFGLRPFGSDAKHWLYDVSLSGVRTAAGLAGAECGLVPPGAARRYRARGVVVMSEPRLFESLGEEA